MEAAHFQITLKSKARLTNPPPGESTGSPSRRRDPDTRRPLALSRQLHPSVANRWLRKRGFASGRPPAAEHAATGEGTRGPAAHPP